MLGAPELWMVLSALVFGAYMGYKGRKGRSKKVVSKFLFVLLPTLILTFILVISLKGALDVPRQCTPCITELIGCNPHCPLDSSLPSGHSATAFAGFASIWIALGMKRKQAPILVLPLLVAISRVALGVHTWIDIISGSLLGLAVTFAVWEIDKRI